MENDPWKLWKSHGKFLGKKMGTLSLMWRAAETLPSQHVYINSFVHRLYKSDKTFISFLLFFPSLWCTVISLLSAVRRFIGNTLIAMLMLYVFWFYFFFRRWSSSTQPHTESFSVLTAILPGEPGLAGFIAAKDDVIGGDNWNYKTFKAPRWWWSKSRLRWFGHVERKDNNKVSK